VLISGNAATSNYSYGGNGGGIYITYASSVYSAWSSFLTNVTVAGNRATYAGGGIYFSGYPLQRIRNSIIWGNSASSSPNTNYQSSYPNFTYFHTLLEQGTLSGTAIISTANPLFVDPKPASSAPTDSGDYRLELCSPAINSGDSTFYTDSIPDLHAISTDLDGNPRIVAPYIDLGCYENGSDSIVKSIASDVEINGDTAICGGTNTILTASLSSSGGMTNPQFKWYVSPSATEEIHTGDTFNTPNLTTNTTYYVSVSGTGVCENTQNERTPITVRVTSAPSLYVTSYVMFCSTVLLTDLIEYISSNCVIRFYRDALGNTLLPSPRVGIMSDTLYYVRAIDTVTGCESSIRTIQIYKGNYPPDNPTTGPNKVCMGDTVTLTNSADGIWSISDPSTGALIDPELHSVKVKGLNKGDVYISYKVGTGDCQTIMTFLLKVVSSIPPTVIIGVERP
jgi:hypothetical protein